MMMWEDKREFANWHIVIELPSLFCDNPGAITEEGVVVILESVASGRVDVQEWQKQDNLIEIIIFSHLCSCDVDILSLSFSPFDRLLNFCHRRPEGVLLAAIKLSLVWQMQYQQKLWKTKATSAEATRKTANWFEREDTNLVHCIYYPRTASSFQSYLLTVSREERSRTYWTAAFLHKDECSWNKSKWIGWEFCIFHNKTISLSLPLSLAFSPTTHALPLLQFYVLKTWVYSSRIRFWSAILPHSLATLTWKR